jgi:hypothetical protein
MSFGLRRCEGCGQILATGRATVCSPRCRTAQWRRARKRAHAATVATLEADNARLGQRVAELLQRMGELQRLVEQLKGRLASRR